MSSFGLAKTSDAGKVSLPAATERELPSGLWPASGIRSFGNQSGLPLVMESGGPVVVPVTGSRRAQLAAKRAMDIALSLAALLFLAPLLIFVAIAIRIDSKGPVLFRQGREGQGGKLFRAFKFRTMWTEAGDLSGVAQTVEGDTRVTPLGRVLRRTSIDELPQLFNVLLGDMSLVGPRPHVPNMRAGKGAYRDLVPYYDARLDMLPGITGWAQANGLRGPTDDAVKAKARVDHDIAYVQNFSLLLDIKILALTIKSEFISGSGS